ncbi:MAG: hypothetical protein Q9160_008417 [Pyrenula sp. 1 TL-2023]
MPSQSPSIQTRPPRKRQPNYHYVHRYALPIRTYPLPTFIPHNPVSVIAIALTYLTQLIAPPSQPAYRGYFSTATGSVHVTDETSIRALWEMGFFGKGSLSRSEPVWLQSQKQKGSTSEEATEKRRKERRDMKSERAKKEKEIIEEKLRQEKRSNGCLDALSMPSANSNDNSTVKSVPGLDTPPEIPSDQQQDHSSNVDQWRHTDTAKAPPTPPLTSTVESPPSPRQQANRTCSDGRVKTVRFSPTTEAREFDLSSTTVSPIKRPGASPDLEQDVSSQALEIENEEHLQLSLEEAFFLAYALGVLDIYLDDSVTKLSSPMLLSLFRHYSISPPRTPHTSPRPDDPFVVSYAVYHFFRSQGWIVRSGVKFAVDYLLYNKGPAFSHAEFAVVVLPSYTDEYWCENPERAAAVEKKTSKSWWWLHCVNRVQAQVLKSLVLCYVDIPPPSEGNAEDIGRLLEKYKVRTVTVKRWTPNRDRG